MTASKSTRLLLILSVLTSVASTIVGVTALPQYFFPTTTLGGVNSVSISTEVARAYTHLAASPLLLSAAQREHDAPLYERARAECFQGNSELRRLPNYPQSLAAMEIPVSGPDALVYCRTASDVRLMIATWVGALVLPLLFFFGTRRIVRWVAAGPD
jgi:hypothetical protein